jgi:hypothetical protein
VSGLDAGRRARGVERPAYGVGRCGGRLGRQLLPASGEVVADRTLRGPTVGDDVADRHPGDPSLALQYDRAAEHAVPGALSYGSRSHRRRAFAEPPDQSGPSCARGFSPRQALAREQGSQSSRSCRGSRPGPSVLPAIRLALTRWFEQRQSRCDSRLRRSPRHDGSAAPCAQRPRWSGGARQARPARRARLPAARLAGSCRRAG